MGFPVETTDGETVIITEKVSDDHLVAENGDVYARSSDALLVELKEAGEAVNEAFDAVGEALDQIGDVVSEATAEVKDLFDGEDAPATEEPAGEEAPADGEATEAP